MRGDGEGTPGRRFAGDTLDLTFAPDSTLTAVAGRGSVRVDLPARQGGAAPGVRAATVGGQGEAGRRFAGDTLDLTFAPDSTLTAVTGRGSVRVDLPAQQGGPASSVRAATFDAQGEAGRGLVSASFTGPVEYREEAQAKRPARLARSTTALRIGLADDIVTSASFAGRVRFEDGDLRASAASAEYEPGTGTLQLKGVDEGGGPRVADAQIQIEADAIDVTLEGPAMSATGTVKTVLQASSAARMPGLLERQAPVNANADGLAYQGSGGAAVYRGGAMLWQGETAVRGDSITLDRRRGDLIVSGAARSNLVFDSGASIGRAAEIRYDDAARWLTYGPPAPTGPGDSASPAPAGPAQLSGAQGDLRAGRIDVQLARSDSRIEGLEAFTDVSILLDRRVATGDRLTYYPKDERYVMTGIATVPVKIVEECRETIGRTVVFFKSADRIIVDGNEEVRTQSGRSGGPCQTPAR
jgi:lipopolysaccharide export system protein LptA